MPLCDRWFAPRRAVHGEKREKLSRLDASALLRVAAVATEPLSLMLLRKRLRRVIALRFTRSASPMATAPSSPMQLSVSQSVFSACQ